MSFYKDLKKKLKKGVEIGHALLHFLMECSQIAMRRPPAGEEGSRY